MPGKLYCSTTLKQMLMVLPVLKKKIFETLHTGEDGVKGNIAILAPGTGLGEACLYWDGKCYRPFATEGGHCDFAPQSPRDIRVYEYMRQKFKHISWELVASGPAIHHLYCFIRDVEKMDEPSWLKDKLTQK